MVRNVANLCVNTDHSLLAALMYAVQVLEVRRKCVCWFCTLGDKKLIESPRVQLLCRDDVWNLCEILEADCF